MRVLLVSPFPVPPASSGAAVRIHRLASWIQGNGHELFFVWAQTKSYDIDESLATARLRRLWGKAAVLEHPGRSKLPDSADWRLDDWINLAHEAPFKTLVEEFHPDIAVVNYVFLSKFLQWIPSGVLRFLDTHDRLSRRSIYERHGIEPGFFHTSEDEEFEGCRRADVVFAIQDGERDYFAQSGVPVAVVGHPEPARYQTPPTNPRPRVGFAAAYNAFNAYSLRMLCRELKASDVLARHDATVSIAGKLVTHAQAKGDIASLPPRVESVGFVPKLSHFYSELDLVINPTLVGTGLKIKTVEAIAHGKPLLSTAVGSDGIPPRSKHHSYDDMAALVQGLDELLTSREQLLGLANVSRHLHTEYITNLERNLLNLFSPGAVGALGSPQGLQPFVSARTGPLAEPDGDVAISLWDPTLRRAASARLAHVLNPVPPRYDSDLYSAQPVTFESIRRAKEYARQEAVDLELLAVLATGDVGPLPDGFEEVPDRARVVSEVASFAHPRPLPLLGDILKTAAAHTTADYLIYTNADIAVLPHFYTYIAEKIRDGHDALIINRRTIDRDVLSVNKLNALYSKIGQPHPGYDCFVFRRDALPEFCLGDVAIGVHLVGRNLLWNILALSQNPLFVDKEHLTFHLGDDNSGKMVDFLDYIEHNTRESIDALEELDRKREFISRVDAGSFPSFAPNLLKLEFDPRLLCEADGRLHSSLVARPIFIHAHFRTGSTALWHAIRSSSHHRAYYEPLHESLADMRLAELDRHIGRFTLKARHDLSGDWLFKEYEELISGGRLGVAGYRRQFAYEGYADNSHQPLLRRYIDGLIQAAHPQQPILQMNRSALRQRWFHREYPEAHHVYLLRNSRDQWASYLRFMKGAARGFARNDALICGMNKHRELIRPIGELVWLHHDFSTGQFFKRYDSVFDSYSWQERYTLFYYLWLQGLLEAAASGSLIVDMDSIARSPTDRMKFENWLATRGARVDLSGLRMTEYLGDELPPNSVKRAKIESGVQSLVVSHFGLSRVRDLAAAGFVELANEIVTAYRETDISEFQLSADRAREVRDMIRER